MFNGENERQITQCKIHELNMVSASVTFFPFALSIVRTQKCPVVIVELTLMTAQALIIVHSIYIG